jgi:uncharacterized protein (TIGR03905 family)
MSKFEYKTSDRVCSSKIELDIEDNIIKSAKIVGGCAGNTQGVCRLAEGRNVDEVISTLKGIQCGMRGTSCPDQLALALEKYKEQ